MTVIKGLNPLRSVSVFLIFQQLDLLNQQYSAVALGIEKLKANWLEPVAKEGRPMRQVEIRITPSMLKNSMLIVTAGIKAGTLSIQERLVVSPSQGVDFGTDVLRAGNKLRSRAPIRRFYTANLVNAGDTVVLTEISDGRWTLNKAQPSG